MKRNDVMRPWSPLTWKSLTLKSHGALANHSPNTLYYHTFHSTNYLYLTKCIWNNPVLYTAPHAPSVSGSVISLFIKTIPTNVSCRYDSEGQSQHQSFLCSHPSDSWSGYQIYNVIGLLLATMHVLNCVIVSLSLNSLLSLI